jgi:hypothetical protein
MSARRSLSSGVPAPNKAVTHEVENPHHGDSTKIETGAERHAVSDPVLQPGPRNNPQSVHSPNNVAGETNALACAVSPAPLSNGVKSDQKNGGIREPRKNISGGLGADHTAKTVVGSKLFLDLISGYLNIKIFAIQPGYKQIPDSFLYHGPHGTTMAVPVTVMLLPRHTALEIIAKKNTDKKRSFGERP